MKKFVILLLPVMIHACGLPQKPRLDRRDAAHNSRQMAESETENESDLDQDGMDTEELMKKEREDMEVLNQTMKERYRSARGVDLRGNRTMLAPGMESATLRSYTSMMDRLSLAFARPAADIPLNDPSTFTIARPLQNDSPNYGSSAYRLFANAVNSLCKGLVAGTPAKFNLAPNAESARVQCQEWGERFWFRAMTPAELQICTNTALEVTKATASMQERWSQTCSVVATAPQFLIVDAQQTASAPPASTPPTGTPVVTVTGDANTGRQLFTASCSGCHGGNRAIRARTDAALQAAAANMNHIGREAYMVPPKVVTVATEYHHILAFLKSLGN